MSTRKEVQIWQRKWSIRKPTERQKEKKNLENAKNGLSTTSVGMENYHSKKGRKK